MSLLLAIVSYARPLPDDAVVSRMLARGATRGAERLAAWRDEHAVLAVARHGWELAPAIGGRCAVAHDDDWVVIADAAIYHRADLWRALRAAGEQPTSGDSADLVRLALRAWGDDAVHRLEGDIAFVAWHRRRRRLLASRDFAGRRPLYWAELGDTLVVASTPGVLLAHPDCPSALNPAAIAEDAAMLSAGTGETAWRAVRVLPAGHALSRARYAQAEVRGWWAPRPDPDAAKLSFVDAAERLRELLGLAVRERTAGRTAVWLSGGWDSTAVYGTAMRARTNGARGEIVPVSMSYPPGDPGREDELIEATTGYWRQEPRWVDARTLPELDLAADGRRRDEPFVHPFEHWNRALARRSAREGVRVVLDGVGGDQLFQVSDVYLADLFRSRDWSTLYEESTAKGVRPWHFRTIWEWIVAPALAGGDEADDVPAHLRRRMPPWLRGDFARHHALEARERRAAPRASGMKAADYEAEWYLRHPFFPRVFSAISQAALDEGVELRSPLYDARVIAFALARPREERASRDGTKRLLRYAMRGLLPDQVLAGRAARTGTTGAVFRRTLMRQLDAWLPQRGASPLADLGIIDPRALRSAAERARSGAESPHDGALFFTLQAEQWLRGHTGAAPVPTTRRTPALPPRLAQAVAARAGHA